MKKPRKVNPTEPMIPRKYTEGQRVVGCRYPTAYTGTFVRAYVTLNENYRSWRNPAYVIKCDVDGKERSFQMLSTDFGFDLDRYPKVFK